MKKASAAHEPIENSYLHIALISLALIAQELIWTRILSAEFFYTFAFLVLSLAVCGMGLGALSIRYFPYFEKDKNLGSIVALAGLSALLGPPLVFLIGLDINQFGNQWALMFKLIATIILLSSSYFFGGVAVAKLLKSNHKRINRIYTADLLGAGAGILVAMLLMNIFGTPITAVLCTIPLIISSVILISKNKKYLVYILAGLTGVFAYFSDSLLELKNQDKAPVSYKYWDAMSKIKVLDYHEKVKGIIVDNKASSNVMAFDGNYSNPESTNIDFGLNCGNLIRTYNNCKFAAIGAGGGLDVLQALIADAKEIHAIEINAHINYMMKEGVLAQYSGNIYNDPRVKVITEDARTYLKRYTNHFDIIYSKSSNSYAALASGAFALAENYLFTVEAVKDFWNALSDNGVLVIEHKSYIPRIVSIIMTAMEELRIDRPQSHIAVYNSAKINGQFLILSKRELTAQLIATAFGSVDDPENGMSMLYPLKPGQKENLVSRIITSGWQSVSDITSIDLSPSTDDCPYIAQLGLWKNLSLKKLDKLTPQEENSGFPLSKLSILAIIFVVLLFVIPFNLLPYFSKDKNRLSASAWLYFFVIGMAFMIIEVILIQRYTLFIGASVYSIITIMMVLLLSSAVGSRFSVNFRPQYIFPVIAMLLALEVFAFPNITSAFASEELWLRLCITIILTTPLGFFLGMPFPTGSTKIGELIDLGFAVNGAGSVLGSTSIMLVVFSFGYSAALIVSLCLYLISYYLYTRIK